MAWAVHVVLGKGEAARFAEQFRRLVPSGDAAEDKAAFADAFAAELAEAPEQTVPSAAARAAQRFGWTQGRLRAKLGFRVGPKVWAGARQGCRSNVVGGHAKLDTPSSSATCTSA